MIRRTYYDVLGVRQDATTDDLKRAYRAKAQQCHPDRNPGVDPALFKELSEAYATLEDPKLREQYDKLLARKVDPEDIERLTRLFQEAGARMASGDRGGALDVAEYIIKDPFVQQKLKSAWTSLRNWAAKPTKGE